ncbi:aspartate aminotransferase [Metarhizium rileyi]|uniref:Aspartate aminotransferase n=1 Tax=Metarhizium rileyi (strain RCEF 4871) TaxID=1649241 RepID=A0A166XKY6_METRR|nr:aspartate aminotransferase [Metarhizium rileyi RCEF 4871]
MAQLLETAFPAEFVPLAPEDENIRLKAALRDDPDTRKLDLSIRFYQDDNAEKWELPAVKMAEEILQRGNLPIHQYLPIAGLPEFTGAAARLVLGEDSSAVVERRVASLQTISATGALHLGALFLSKFYRCSSRRSVLVPDPSWSNHHKIFANVGLCTETYPYFSAENTKGLDFDGIVRSLETSARGSIIVLHACGHNPTGWDPSRKEWEKMGEIIRKRQHLPVFDCTYQGLASGSLSQDAWAIRHFVDQGLEVFIAQSFAKTCGLYGQRIGCLHVVTAGPNAQDTARRVSSQLAILQRCEISSPPSYGAFIVSLILTVGKLFSEWEANLRIMSGRIMAMRSSLRSKLEAMETPGDWTSITDQKGMYCFLSFSDTQLLRLREEFHVYLASNGRISMAGLNRGNVDYFARAVDQVVREGR